MVRTSTIRSFCVSLLLCLTLGGVALAQLNDDVVRLGVAVATDESSLVSSSPTAQLEKAQAFTRVRAALKQGELLPVIVELDVPASIALTHASIAAKGAGAVARADAQLRLSIKNVIQREVAKLAGMPHRVTHEFSTIPFMAMRASPEAIDALERSPIVVGINQDWLARPTLNNTVGIIGAVDAWARELDGTGWYVAILDTGVFTEHDFFSGKDVVEACFATGENGNSADGDCPNGASVDINSPNAAQPYSSIFGGFDHGTHVAGIALGNGPSNPAAGVARGANLIAIQVFSRFFSDATCDPDSQCVLSFSSDQIKAMEYLFSIRATYSIASLNMSLGGGQYTTQASCDSSNSAVKAAIDVLRAIDIASVIAAGNAGFCDALGGPGCISTAIGVGATTDADNEVGFSSFHPTMLDIYAPGVSVISSTTPPSAYGNKSGTSMATPHVAGTWAIMRQALPAESVDFILTALQSTGSPVSGRCVSNPSQRRIQIDVALDQFAPGIRPCKLVELIAFDAEASAEFGVSSAVSGMVAVVGARSASCDIGSRCGAAYAYRWDGSEWIFEDKLQASDRAELDFFASALSARGDVILSGSSFADIDGNADAGAAYVYRHDGTQWNQEQKLVAGDPDAGDRFGSSVALGDNFALLGAKNDGNTGSSDGPGAVYVVTFDGTDWLESQKLVASNPASFAEFGSSVSVSGQVAVVGSPATSCGAGLECGTAYVFRFDGKSWNEEQRLEPADRAEADNFSFSVSVSGDVIMVGSPFSGCDAGGACGAVYVFEWSGSTWEQVARVSAWDAAALDFFGTSLSLNDQTALIGAYSNDCNAGNNCGSAYVMRRNPSGEWFLDAKLFEQDLAAIDQFGWSVALDGSLGIVGARLRDSLSLENSGAAYAYGIANDCNANGMADTCDIVSGTSFDIDNNGLPDECNCHVPAAPQPDATERRNRFLTFSGGDSVRPQAIRVVLSDLPPPFHAFNGTALWVNEPRPIPENSGVTDPSELPGDPTFLAATLGCEPVYRDWGLSGLVHVYHELIVPDGTYNVQVIGEDCNLVIPDDFSASLMISTSIWGDVLADCASSPCGPPDDSVDVVTDVTGILDKFRNLLGSPAKSRSDLEPSLIDLLINISDVTFALNGFQGDTYPFDAPAQGPCP